MQWDLKHVWHPFTQQTEWEKDARQWPMVIAKAKGVYLYDDKGQKYIDGISSLWTNLHGHQNPILNSAIQRQLKKMAHSTFLGLTHEPGIRLARELVRILPHKLTRIFYSDNGSTAVEVALKMAYQYHLQEMEARKHRSKDTEKYKAKAAKTEFLALEDSYHGDTIGSVSVGGISLFHKKFRPLLFKTHFAMSPDCIKCPYKTVVSDQCSVISYQYKGQKPSPGDYRKETGCRWQCLGEVETILEKHKEKMAAAIIEPVVQGACGIRVMPAGYVHGFAELCKKYNVLLIADEVASGFGRTGKTFACEHENVQPDLMCLAKGITGGYLPLAVTAASEKIYQAFLGRYDEFKTFFHGHTYTANPLASAVSLANLEIFKDGKTLRKVRYLEKNLSHLLAAIAEIPLVGQVRQAGLMAGIELVKDKQKMISYPPGLRVGKKVCFEARKYGVLLRPLGDVIVLMPPLSITEKELRKLVDGVKKSILKISRLLSRIERHLET